MAQEWIMILRRAVESLEPKIDDARYRLECCGRKSTPLNLTRTESHVITLALAKYKDWLNETDREERVSCETSKIC